MIIKVNGSYIDLNDGDEKKPEPMEVSHTDLIIGLGIVGFAFLLCGIMMAAI